MPIREIVLCAPVRTAIGAFNGSLKNIPATELGATVLKSSVERASINPEHIDSVLMGNVVQAGNKMNPARQAAIHARLPVQIPAMTLNRVCGSGAQAIVSVALEILAGESLVVLAGGMENMDRAPYRRRDLRQPGDSQLRRYRPEPRVGAGCDDPAQVSAPAGEAQPEPRQNLVVSPSKRPDGVRNQLEGGIIQSASWTLLERLHYGPNGVSSHDWSEYPILRFSSMPEQINVDILDQPGKAFLGVAEAAQARWRLHLPTRLRTRQAKPAMTYLCCPGELEE